MGSLKLGNVWVFVQLIRRPIWTKNQLYKRLPISSGRSGDDYVHFLNS